MKYTRQAKVPALEICDENGKTLCVVDFDGNYFAKRNAIRAALGNIEKIRDDVNTDDEDIGMAVLDLVKIVFGEENAKKIVTAFASNYYELVTCVSDYLYTDVFPTIEKISKQLVEAEKRKFK